MNEDPLGASYAVCRKLQCPTQLKVTIFEIEVAKNSLSTQKFAETLPGTIEEKNYRTIFGKLI